MISCTLPDLYFCQGSSGPDDLFEEEDSYSPSSLISSSSSRPTVSSVQSDTLCTSCGLEIVDRYLLKVSPDQYKNNQNMFFNSFFV